MSMFSLCSQKVLDSQMCSVCRQYLSCGPIQVSKSDGPACGRCSKLIKGAPSLANLLIPSLIFPCVNRFDGCNRLLRSDEVLEHEVSCASTSHYCLQCPKDKYSQLSLLYLLHHYKLFHKKYYLIEAKFSVEASSSGSCEYLHCDEENSVLSIVKVQVLNGKLAITFHTLGRRDGSVGYTLRVNGDNCSSKSATTYNYIVNINSTSKQSLLCEFRIDLVDLLKVLNLAAAREIKENPKLDLVPLVSEISLKIEEFMTKQMPKIKQKPASIEKWGNLKEVSKLTDHGTVTFLVGDDGREFKTFCSLCENYFPLVIVSRVVYSCTHWEVCNSCYLRCRSRHLGEFSKYCPLVIGNKNPAPDLQYYCRHGCGQSLSISDYWDHEESCSSNPTHNLASTEIMNMYFLEPKNGSLLVLYNNYVCLKRDKLNIGGVIYMVTQYKFCCTITSNYKKGETHFSITHKYPQCYRSLVKIIEDREVFRTAINEFSVKSNVGLLELFICVRSIHFK